MTSHVDANEIAAYAEGLLRPRKRGRVASHLAACPACTRTLGQLAGVTDLLAAVPAPALPDGVCERLDRALAAEVARVPAGGAPRAARAGAAPDAGQTRPARARRGRLARLPVAARLAAAAAALALLGGGGYLISQAAPPLTSGASAGRSAASAGSPLPGRHAPALGPQAANGLSRPAAPRVITSGTRYQPGALASQVEAVLGRFPALGQPLSTTGSEPAAARLAPATLAGCADAVTRGRRPLLVDLARYAGRPAAVIVAQAGSRRLVWVVPRGCTARRPGVIATATLPG